MPESVNLPDRTPAATDVIYCVPIDPSTPKGWAPLSTLVSAAWASAALATNATTGFRYWPTCAGTPTGVPTAYAGVVPMVYDTNANKIWVYSGGAWKSTAALT